MTGPFRRQRDYVKAALLLLTVLLVGSMSWWTIRGLLYALGGLFAVVGLFAAGMLLDLYVGFRRFESRVDELARQTCALQRRAAATRMPRIAGVAEPYGYVGRDCKGLPQ